MVAICMTSWARPCWLYVLRAPPTVGGEPPTIGGNHRQRPQVSPPTPPTPNPKLLGVYPKRLGVLTPNVGGSRPPSTWSRGVGSRFNAPPPSPARRTKWTGSGPEVDHVGTVSVHFWTTIVSVHFQSVSVHFSSRARARVVKGQGNIPHRPKA